MNSEKVYTKTGRRLQQKLSDNETNVKKNQKTDRHRNKKKVDRQTGAT